VINWPLDSQSTTKCGGARHSRSCNIDHLKRRQNVIDPTSDITWRRNNIPQHNGQLVKLHGVMYNEQYEVTMLWRDRNASIIITKPHRLHKIVHKIRPVGADVARSVVCVSVCLCRAHD